MLKLEKGSNGKGKNTITVREDSFSYTLGDGMYKRFGEITIRVEDFMLRRTGDRSVPGSEVPVERGQDFFDPDSQISSTDSPVDRHKTAPAYGRPPHEARIDSFVSIEA